MKRAFKVGEWVRLRTNEKRFSDGLRRRDGHAVCVVGEYDIHYAAHSVRLQGGDVLSLGISRLEPLPFQPGDRIRNKATGTTYSVRKYVDSYVFLDEVLNAGIVISISLLTDYEKVENTAETRMVRASTPVGTASEYFHYDGSTYRLADANEAILAACPQIIPGTLVVAENYEKCSLSITCSIESDSSIAMTKAVIKKALRGAMPAGIGLEMHVYYVPVIAPPLMTVSLLEPDSFTKLEIERLKAQINERFKLTFPSGTFKSEWGNEPVREHRHFNSADIKISSRFEPFSISREELAKAQEAFDKGARAIQQAFDEVRPERERIERNVAPNYRPCPRCGRHIYRVDGKDLPCKDCGYPGLRPLKSPEQYMPSRFTLRDLQQTQDGDVEMGPAIRPREAGQLLKEQHLRERYAPLRKTSFCWHCGHDRGCMHPRKEKA